MSSKRIYKFLVIGLLVSIVLNFCFLLKNYNHDCTHTEDCPICILIHQTEDNLKNLGLGFDGVTIVLLCIILIKNVYYKSYKYNIIDSTLVGLKVRLND